MKKIRSTKTSYYPPEYNKVIASERTPDGATARFGKAFNKWTSHIREANLIMASQSGMNTTLEKAKHLIGL